MPSPKKIAAAFREYRWTRSGEPHGFPPLFGLALVMPHEITLAPPDGNSKFSDFQQDHWQRPFVLYDTRKRTNRRRVEARGLRG